MNTLCSVEMDASTATKGGLREVLGVFLPVTVKGEHYQHLVGRGLNARQTAVP